MPIRFGLVKLEHLRNREAQARMADSRGWAPQVANLAGPAPFREALAQKRAFGDWFHPVVRMPDRVYRDHLRVRRLRATIAWGTYAFGTILSGSLLLLLVRSQSRRQMDSRRLAALAHSLKTPLAMMKMRCDSALNANLSRERQVAHLLRVGDGVEKLLHIIEHGLEPFRVAPDARPEDTWPAAFFQDLEAEFLPPFEELGRVLEVNAGRDPIRTSPSSLRSALSILVENALLHGRGTVRLATEAGPKGTLLRVHDEGTGIPRGRLALLRPSGGEPPGAVPTALGTSQGLGLQLLLSLAHREGWGLELEYGVDGGFGVLIKVPR